MNTKKLTGLALLTALIVSLTLTLALAGCGGQGTSASAGSGTEGSAADGGTVIKVGASPAPHAEILAQVKDILAGEGYTLEVVEYSDYIQPNEALSDGTLDANYFQHIAYLENYNDENGTNLVSAGGVHFEPLCLYPGKTLSLDALGDGAEIAVPSDPTNEARALLLLEDEGLITLKEGVGLEATPNDIASNPRNIVIVEAEAAALPRTLEDVDAAVINGNYAIGAGLDPDTALASEDVSSAAAERYVNVIAVRAGDEDSDKIKALVKALQSTTVKTYIEQTYNGAVLFVS
ncbi:MAG: MetQ/NlpA family ABC transporter substrate-binding protein [Coriobacteriales bacterium]|jgi:D-methionine transport system substrate-binding protein|nr:MetQ/NlpA family ABC transporter substrate-binding protein [Coriobacteriales bacterium]